MNKNFTKKTNRAKRHRKIRAKVFGTSEKPRVSVFKSNQHIYAQIIDDGSGKVVASFSDKEVKKGVKTEKSRLVGEGLAKKIKEKGVNEIVFDRGGFKFHGRVKALADGLRKGGIKF